MRKVICIIISLLMLLPVITGCSQNAQQTETQQPIETGIPQQAEDVPVFETPSSDFVIVIASPTNVPVPTAIPTATPSPEPTKEPTPEPIPEDMLPVITPEPTPTPEPTATPEPTPTPEPNPYIGIWTIEDLPLSIELRADGTYLATSVHSDREGTYTYNSSGVVLHPDAENTLDLHYYAKADAFKLGELVLQRDDLVFFRDLEGIPITFRSENDDLTVSVRGAVVEAVAKNGKVLQQYCFTKAGLTPPEKSRDWFDVTDSGEPSDILRVYKYDGNYTLWTRDVEGNPYQPIDVTVVSGFLYPIRAEGLDYIRTAVKTLLKEQGTTVDEMNRIISKDIAAAGIYTRAGVVTSGVSLISNMAKHGYSIVYQGHGSFQAARNWGINPNWGAKLDEPTSDPNGVYYYTGMQCVASIVWAYKQAGLNLSSEVNSKIGTLGERTRAHDNEIAYDRAESGDIVKQSGHYLMVIDRLDQNNDGEDDAYLTYEMWAPHLTMLILTFRQVRGREFFSMDALFDGTGRNAKKAYYWKNTFRIPIEEMPQYLQEALEEENLEHNYYTLLDKLGFEE